MTGEEKSLDGLFFPEMVCLQEDVLKYLVLMYDRLFFLPNDVRVNPGHESIRKRFSLYDSVLAAGFGSQRDAHNSLMYASEEHVWEDWLKRLMDMYDVLEDHDVCVPLKDDFGLWSKDPLDTAIDIDMHDRPFLQTCLNSLNTRYFVPKTPDSAAIKGGGMLAVPLRYKGKIGFASLCSQRVNGALFFAEKYSLIPVSRRGLFVGLFHAKLRRVLACRGEDEDRRRDYLRKATFDSLHWNVLTEVVTRDVLRRRGIGDILRYKQETREMQAKLRKHLFELSCLIGSKPWDPAFHDEIKRVVVANVIPEVEALRSRKRAIWEKLFDEALKEVLDYKKLAALVALYLVPHVSYGQLLGTATAAWLSQMGKKLVDARREEIEIRRNALFFIVNL